MKKLLLLPALLFAVLSIQAQVKIGNNPATINSNSMLEIESTDKGFLPPRVTLSGLASVSPLSGTVPAGMLIYNTGGAVSAGYFYWSGTEWKKLENGNKITVAKTATTTLLKSESYVVASNDITLSLPVVTSADNGLQITVNNIGTHTDLVVVKGNGAATIDGYADVSLTRYVAMDFIAYEGNWLVSNTKKPSLRLMEVNEKGSWATLDEAIGFLDVHMDGPTVIKLADESYEITNTLVINLPYSLTIQGNSYGTANIEAGSGLTGKPMFRCFSDVYFKMLNFDATTLASYGNLAGEDAIRLLGSGTYNEIKDCSFDNFNTTILDSTNAELWVFECDISNAKSNGILMHSAVSGAVVKVAETDFIQCKRGVNFSKGNNTTIQLASGTYYMANSNDTAIVYRPSTFTSITSMSVTGNSWNNIGKYIEGFDFTRTDGRDANVKMESNAGAGDKKPYSFINVINSNTTKTLSSSSTWYKADWGSNTSEVTCKWTITGNKIAYQPGNRRNGIFSISGNLSVNQSNRVISICIVKNGVTSTRYGETTLRTSTSNQPYQFSFIAFLEEMAPGDYFEIYYNTTTSGDVVKIQDIQWLVTAQ